MPPAPRPSSTPLAGSFVVYHEEYGKEGVIEVARRLEHPEGRVAFIVEYEDVDEKWELRVESSDGRSFRGVMSSPEWGDTEYAVEMTLWTAPDDDEEWLLLGTWTDEEDAVIDWSITLFVDEDE